MKTTLRKISEALHREERRAGQKIGYVITVKYPKNTRKEYMENVTLTGYADQILKPSN